MLSYWDSELTCRYANPAFCEWFGLDAAAVVGTSLEALPGREAFGQKQQHIAGVLAGKPQEFECVMVGVHGQHRHGLAHYVPEQLDGEVIGFVVQVADITELHQARLRLLAERERWTETHQRLLRSEEALRQAQQLGNMGSWEWEIEPDIVWWSEQLYAIFGRDPRLLPPSYAEHGELYAPDSWACLQRVVTRLLEAGEPFKVDLEYRRPDGTRGWIEGRGAAERDGTGRITRLHGTTREVSAERRSSLRAKRRKHIVALHRELKLQQDSHRRLEQALANARKLETLGLLSGGIAHDFNNVLAAVLASLQLLKRRRLDPPAMDLVARGLSAVDRATRLVRQLMAFARTQQDAAQVTNLGDLLLASRDLLQLTTGTRITVSIDVAQSGFVLIDRSQLEVALLNLAVNARDAMPHGGTLRLSVTRCGQVASRQADAVSWLQLTVADTGTGMAPQTLARACEPFFTTKLSDAGTGLGLPMVAAFAERSGGSFALDSALGNGTTATLCFPEVPRGNSSPPPAPKDEVIDRSAHGGATILVVDDDDLVRSSVEQYLADLGYRVLTASNGVQALFLVRNDRQIDLVVADMAMPVMDGAQLVHKLGRLRPGLPSLLMSGRSEDVSDGGSFLAKPFSQAQLATRVSEVLLARRVSRPRAELGIEHPHLRDLYERWQVTKNALFSLEGLAAMESEGRTDLSRSFVSEVVSSTPVQLNRVYCGSAVDDQLNQVFDFGFAVGQDGRLVAGKRAGYRRCVVFREPVYERMMLQSEDEVPILCERLLLPCVSQGLQTMHVLVTITSSARPRQLLP